MEIRELPLAGLRLIEPRRFDDARGWFFEAHHHRKLRDAGFSDSFVQDNVSYSSRNVLRGLHFQYPAWQGKLVMCLAGEIFDVAVDLRRDSPTFGKWHAEILSARILNQLYIPPGFAHGFCVTGDEALVHYKCTEYYSAADEQTLVWNDPDIGIAWPVRNPVLSEKDANGKPLAELVLA
jgi:dTDP-4-dehydrorhamnose 3,5-epimerase